MAGASKRGAPDIIPPPHAPKMPKTQHSTTTPLKPVIGILSHPGDGASGRLNKSTHASNIPASYVKFVEAGGARVIPHIYNESLDTLHKKLDLVNGVILTGGMCMEGPYLDAINAIFEYVIKKNDEGNYFPLYAICLGFELLLKIISKDNGILENIRVERLPSTLEFFGDMEGTVFGRFPPDLIRLLGSDNLVFQNHKWSLSPEKFEKNPHLCGFFRILNTSVSSDDKVYISTVQALKYPIVGIQWHPEKNAFEWGYATIPHSEEAVQVTQYMANYLVSEARKSPNKPDDQEVLANIIYKHHATFGGYGGIGYDQVYIFDGAGSG